MRGLSCTTCLLNWGGGGVGVFKLWSFAWNKKGKKVCICFSAFSSKTGT